MRQHIDIAAYVEGWCTRLKADIHRARALRQRAREEAERIAGRFARTFPCRRIVLLGSTVEEGPFDERSDIDLAVEGMPPKLYTHACAVLAGWTEWSVDVIPYESANDLMLERIHQEGVVLYDAHTGGPDLPDHSADPEGTGCSGSLASGVHSPCGR